MDLKSFLNRAVGKAGQKTQAPAAPPSYGFHARKGTAGSAAVGNRVRQWTDDTFFEVPDRRTAAADRHDAALENEDRIRGTVLRPPEPISRAMGSCFGH